MGELFEVNTSQQRFDANKVEILENGKYPYVVRTSLNNGIKGYINEDKHFLNDGNTISFGQDTVTMFYQEKPYFTGDKIKILKSKDKRFNKKNAQFFILTMAKSFSSFSWGSSSFSVKIIENQKISLPTLNGKINFQFMENFITEMEVERITKLEAYLVASGLKDYTLTVEEEKVLEDFERVKFDKFKIEDLFKINTGRDVIIGNVENGSIPLISHQHNNNGISKEIAELSNRRLFNFKTTLPLADRGVFLATTQNKNFHIGTRVKALTFKEGKKTLENRLFFVASINKLQILFTDYSSNATDNLPNLYIALPVKDSQPDYVLMETLISAIQKQIIKAVVLYVDKKTATV